MALVSVEKDEWHPESDTYFVNVAVGYPHHDGLDPENLSSDEARDLAQELLTAAAEAERLNKERG